MEPMGAYQIDLTGLVSIDSVATGGDLRGLRWQAFAEREPDLARSGREMLYRFGPGLAYLATVSRGGMPRIHPVCPALVAPTRGRETPQADTGCCPGPENR